MKLSKDEFKKLQQHWYQVLADHGFEDIEQIKNGRLTLTPIADRFYEKTRDAFWREDRESYFRVLGQLVHDQDTFFRSDTDRLIMTRYAEGSTVKAITEELALFGVSRHRHSIRFVIRRYEVKWQIRNYNHKQLNVKIG